MSRGRSELRDVAVAVATVAALVVYRLTTAQPPHAFDVLGYAVLVAGGLSLVLGRRMPTLVIALTGACVLGNVVIGFTAPTLAYLIAVYFAFRARKRLMAIVASVVMLVAVPAILVAGPPAWPLADAITEARDILPLAWLVAAAAAGEALRQAESRADEAVRTREEVARRLADEERLHIARELHDSLTHLISVMKVQAETAVHLAGKRGEAVPDALLAIRSAAREASHELRTTLETIRAENGESRRGLDELPRLIGHARTTGLDAQLIVSGGAHPLPDPVDSAAYRIVQESLTNIARHAAATTAEINIDYRPGLVVIGVDDDGRATPTDPIVPGVGLLGMGERVAALGGRFRAEPRAEGGFSVRAELPTGRGA